MDSLKKIQMYPFIDNLHTIHNSIIAYPPKGYEFIGLPSNNFFKFVKKTNNTKVWRAIVRFCYHQFLKVFKTTKIIDATQKSRIMDEADIIFTGTPSIYETQKPWVLYLFDNPACLAGNNYELFLKEKPKLEKQLSSNSCKRIIAANEAHIDFLKKHFSKKVTDKTVVIKPAIEDHGLRHKKRGKKFKILFMGSTNIPQDFYAKGGLDVIRVFKELSSRKDIEMIIRCKIFDEKLRNEVKSIPHVTLIDEKLPFDKIIELYKNTDLLFLPGHNYSVSSTIEAMSFGIPIVALNTYAVQDFIKDMYSGVIVKRSKLIEGYNNPAYPTYIRSDEFMNEIMTKEDQELIDRLKKVIVFLIERPDEVERLGKNARKRYEENHTIEVRNREFKKVFDEIIDDKS